jgi:hypothetical protein
MQLLATTKFGWLKPFKEILAVYAQSHKKPIKARCGQNAELLTTSRGNTKINLRIAGEYSLFSSKLAAISFLP